VVKPAEAKVGAIIAESAMKKAQRGGNDFVVFPYMGTAS